MRFLYLIVFLFLFLGFVSAYEVKVENSVELDFTQDVDLPPSSFAAEQYIQGPGYPAKYKVEFSRLFGNSANVTVRQNNKLMDCSDRPLQTFVILSEKYSFNSLLILLDQKPMMIIPSLCI